MKRIIEKLTGGSAKAAVLNLDTKMVSKSIQYAEVPVIV